MARTGRPKAVLELTADEREQLQRWARRRTSAQALAMRSRIVLACAQGRSNTAVADELGVSVQMVGKWRARFVEARLDGLADDPRPGRPASITGEQVEDIVLATLESTPANATHWSRAKMAERTGLSKSSMTDLEGLRPQAAPRRHLQAVHRPAVRREGLRRRRAVPQPTRGRSRALGGREAAGSGPGAVPAGVPDDPCR